MKNKMSFLSELQRVCETPESKNELTLAEGIPAGKSPSLTKRRTLKQSLLSPSLRGCVAIAKFFSPLKGEKKRGGDLVSIPRNNHPHLNPLPSRERKSVIETRSLGKRKGWVYDLVEGMSSNGEQVSLTASLFFRRMAQLTKLLLITFTLVILQPPISVPPLPSKSLRNRALIFEMSLPTRAPKAWEKR